MEDQRITELEKTITELEDINSRLESRIEELDEHNDKLIREIDEKTERINELEGVLKDIYNSVYKVI